MTELLANDGAGKTAFEKNATVAGELDEPVEKATKPVRVKDDIFWTELEIRRLGNLVAECINARRYVGDETKADEERQLMRKYIDAMKRKSMRVLHRAELYSQSGYSAWPGIDPSIMDPISLAEEYVRVVQNYEAVLSEEETRAREARSDREAEREADGDGALEQIKTETEDWELADDIAYREALEREKKSETTNEEKRKDLMGEIDGLRRRKADGDASRQGDPSSPTHGKASYSKEEEELMARHQPIQDELTSNLVDLVGELKESISANNERLREDDNVLDQTEDAVDKNVTGIEKQRLELKKYTQSTSTSWWVMMIAAVVILIVFLFVLILLKIPL